MPENPPLVGPMLAAQAERPPADGDCGAKPLSCPVSFQQKIWTFVEPLIDKEGWDGRGWISYHKELHEQYDRLARADPETATFGAAWLNVLGSHRTEAREKELRSKGEGWEIEDGRSILWRPAGISLKIERESRKAGDLVLPVIAGYLRPLRRVFVEGWVYFEVQLSAGQKVVASADDLLRRLERDGRVRKKKWGHDILVEVLHHFTDGSDIVARPAYGVYADEKGNLELCQAAVPVRDEQLLAQEQVEPFVTRPVTAGAIARYFELLPFFHPSEIYPAMGLAAMSPVAGTLREKDVFVGHLWNWSLGHGLGKSLICIVYSRQLWGRVPSTGDAINAEFRLAAHLDAACVPTCIEEAETLKMDRLGPMLKTSAERGIVSRRGNTMLAMVPYYSRGILFFSGNRLTPRSGPALSRFLAPRFDSAQAAARKEAKPRLDRLVAALEPIGHVLAEQLVRDHPRLDSLLLRIRDVEAEISRTGAAQGDIRRAQMWAVAYIGLETWASAAKTAGLDWSPPEVAEFIRDVVRPVDESTYAGEETVVDAFRSWFESWRVRNIGKVTQISIRGDGREGYDREEEVRGTGSLFQEHEIAHDGHRIHGWLVTKTLATEYNRTAPPDLQISSLQDLAIASADEIGLPHGEFLEPNGKVKRQPFGARKERTRAVFVARERERDDGGA